MKNENILLNDEYKIFDKLMEQQLRQPKIGPLGWVRAYIQSKNQRNRELFFEGSNMVVAQGRFFVAQKIFEVADTGADYTRFKVSHFGIGAGGATIDGDAVSLLGPYVCDTALYKPIGLSSYLNEPGNYDNSQIPDNLKELYTSRGAVKPIDNITLVEEDYDETGGTCTYKTKVKCECIVGAGEPPALAVNGTVPINEAALVR